jgi:CBS domain-containing protein
MTVRQPVVKDYMTTKLINIVHNQPVYDAIKTLLSNRISGAPVVDESGKLVGVLSEKDCLRIFANGSFHNLPASNVADYMSKIVTTVSPDTDVFTAADIFLKHTFRRLPVMDGDNLVGIISRRDVLKAVQDAFENDSYSASNQKEYLSEEMKAILK